MPRCRHALWPGRCALFVVATACDQTSALDSCCFYCALNSLIMTDTLEATPMELAETTSPAADGPGRSPSTSDPMEGCPTLSAIPHAYGPSVESAVELHAQGAQLPAAASSRTGCFAKLPAKHVVTIQPHARAIVNEEQVCVCTAIFSSSPSQPGPTYQLVPAIIAPDQVMHDTCSLHADSVPLCRVSRPCLLSASHDPHSRRLRCRA